MHRLQNLTKTPRRDGRTCTSFERDRSSSLCQASLSSSMLSGLLAGDGLIVPRKTEEWISNERNLGICTWARPSLSSFAFTYTGYARSKDFERLRTNFRTQPKNCELEDANIAALSLTPMPSKDSLTVGRWVLSMEIGKKKHRLPRISPTAALRGHPGLEDPSGSAPRRSATRRMMVAPHWPMTTPPLTSNAS